MFQLVLPVGASHLRSLADGLVPMPEDLMCTGQGDFVINHYYFVQVFVFENNNDKTLNSCMGIIHFKYITPTMAASTQHLETPAPDTQVSRPVSPKPKPKPLPWVVPRVVVVGEVPVPRPPPPEWLSVEPGRKVRG